MGRAFLVVGLGYGDEGKGSIVDYLAKEHNASLVVRFNGGPQAAHNVVMEDGRHHTFAQWGSATLRGVPTYLSQYMLIEPFAMWNEAEHLTDECGISRPFDYLSVDPWAVVITPYHWILNRARERARGDDRHGSCGFGLGEARRMQLAGDMVLRAQDMQDSARCIEKLAAIAAAVLEEAQMIDQPINLPSVHEVNDFYGKFQHLLAIRVPPMDIKSNIIFEGAQGVLLDEKHGTFPHNTWTNCTFRNAEEILYGTGFTRERIGVLRTYMTRHGAGPLSTEDPAICHTEPHNDTGEWQGAFRKGHFNADDFNYAITCCGGLVDQLALTHVDKIGEQWKAYAKGWSNVPKQHVVDWIESCLELPIGILSHGPKSSDKMSHEAVNILR